MSRDEGLNDARRRYYHLTAAGCKAAREEAERLADVLRVARAKKFLRATMFETLCALLLRLYPAEFRHAYGREAVQLMKDRARHERGVFRRVRLLMDLAIDLGATSFHGWQSGKPLLATIDGPPHFDSIEIHGPRPMALAVGVLISMLMFAAFPLLLPKALSNATAHLGERFGTGVPGAGSNHAAQQGTAADPESRRKLIAAIASNLKERYVDRAIGQQLADAWVACPSRPRRRFQATSSPTNRSTS